MKKLCTGLGLLTLALTLATPTRAQEAPPDPGRNPDRGPFAGRIQEQRQEVPEELKQLLAERRRLSAELRALMAELRGRDARAGQRGPRDPGPGDRSAAPRQGRRRGARPDGSGARALRPGALIELLRRRQGRGGGARPGQPGGQTAPFGQRGGWIPRGGERFEAPLQRRGQTLRPAWCGSRRGPGAQDGARRRGRSL